MKRLPSLLAGLLAFSDRAQNVSRLVFNATARAPTLDNAVPEFS